MNKAVIGLGFGDEGKGATVNWLAEKAPESTVVRYSGGHQAGHHVWLNEETDHIFSSFGSGTLQGCDTYIKSPCVISPEAIWREYGRLLNRGCDPELTIDPKCPIVTPLDVGYNRNNPDNLEHGTCGCGINATLERERDNYSLLVGDLLYPEIFKAKLKLIDKHYYNGEVDWGLEEFYDVCVTSLINIISISDVANTEGGYIFEGSQGLLLDKDIGFFPHCTPYNVGMRGIMPYSQHTDAYYVTRAYSTRHGSGPMLSKPLPLNPTPLEINVYNDYQKGFRTSVLNVDLLEYGLSRDAKHQGSSTLVVTCLEHMKELVFKYGGVFHTATSETVFCRKIAKLLNMPKFVMCKEHHFSDVYDTGIVGGA